MFPIVLRLDQVPNPLRNLKQWVFWRWEERNGKRAKVPYTFMGYHASSTNPGSWSHLEFLLEILRKNPAFAAGMGFVVTGADGFCGIDLDDCLTDCGTLKLWAVGIVDQFADTYTEVTPSGAGLRIWCLATAARALKKSLPDGAIEIYTNGRYFTFTGNRFGDAPLEITDHQADVDQLLRCYALTGSASHGPSRIGPKIAAGDRYKTFCSIAGTLIKRGVCDEGIEAAILAINAHQAEPPKSDAEIQKDVRKILASAQRWS
jgi:primase-polymerase (primpol)-like protein